MSATAQPDTDDLRRATLWSTAVCAGVFAVLLVTFGLVLSPVDLDDGGCNTSLAPSAFRDALGPLHLLAAIVISASIWALAAARRGRDRPGTPTLVVLGAAWVYIGACWAEHDLFTPAGVVGVFGGPSVGLAGLAILAVTTVLVARSRAPRELRWRRHAAAAQVLLWGALVLGLPASLGYAWLSGADAFCF